MRNFSKQVMPPERQASVTNSTSLADQAESTKTLAAMAAAAAKIARERSGPLTGERRPAASIDAAFSAELSKQSGVTDDIPDVQKGRVRSSASPAVSPNIDTPQFDYVDVRFSRKKGSVDGFYTVVKFSVPAAPAQSGRLRAVKIFRADVSNNVVHPLNTISMLGLSRISSMESRKNPNTLEMHERRLREANRSSTLSSLLPVDATDGSRQEATSVVPSPGRAGNVRSKKVADRALDGYLNPGESIGSIDPSVATNLNFLKSIQRSRSVKPIGIGQENAGSADVDQTTQRSLQIRQVESLARLASTAGANIVEDANARDFRELGVFSLDAFRKRVVKDFLELSFEDVTVTFGKTYRYYIVSVDSSMAESPRSRIVTVTVVPAVAPGSPDVTLLSADSSGASFVMVSSGSIVPEKFEIYRREQRRVSEQGALEVSTAATREGYTVGRELRAPVANGYVQVGEVQAGPDGGAVFRDRRVSAGRTYDYSFYSVDSFGNKSQTPSTAEAYIFDPLRPRALRRPNIVAEPYPDGMKVSIQTDDDQCSAIVLTRRNLTLDKSNFCTPSQGARSILGRQRDVKSRSSMVGAHVGNQSWTGTFVVAGTGSIVFDDKFARRDMTYQYRAHIVDRYGNESAPGFSSISMVTLVPKVEAPLFLSASFDGAAVRVSWQNANVDIDSLDLIGSQDALADSSVRSLFQVERRQHGADLWERFPLVTGSYLLDPVLSGSAPSSRPPWPRPGNMYEYRISAIQTGSFISDFVGPVSVRVHGVVPPPAAVSVRASDTKIRPFYVSIGWMTPEGSATVDRWEIERAAVNNISAARINLKNRAEVTSLSYLNRAVISRESSRGYSRSVDPAMRGATTARIAAPGDHSFLDDDVTFGNSYIYRIRAVGLDGSKSSWVYRGVTVRDELFDAKLNLTQKERVALASGRAPMVPRKK